MGRQIIKQPNGKYCVFSSIVDNIICYDCTEQEIIDLWSDEEREKIDERVKEIISKLEKGEKPYFQFTQTYKETISLIEEIHGKEESDHVKSFLEL